MRRASAVAASLALLAGGCVSVERVGRPPSAAEIARINRDALANSTFALQYAPRVTTFAVGPLDSCTGGACGPPATSNPTGIASVDPTHVTFSLRDGGQAALPFNDLVGVRTGSGRGRGAIIGGAVGAGIGVGLAAVIIVGLSSTPGEHGAPTQCKEQCGESLAGLALTTAFIGGLLGAAIGIPHVFQFDDDRLSP